MSSTFMNRIFKKTRELNGKVTINDDVKLSQFEIISLSDHSNHSIHFQIAFRYIQIIGTVRSLVNIESRLNFIVFKTREGH